MKKFAIVSLFLISLSGCRSDENSSSLDATASTSDQYVYYIKEFCSKENKKLRLAETGRKEEEILELQVLGVTYTPCKGEKIREAFSNFTPEDVEEAKERYRSRNEKYNLLNNP